LFSLASELASHLQSLGTLLVPTRARARAVQLAHAARAVANGAQVWRSADVLTPAAWMGREAGRLATLAGAAGQPRLLSSAEEWYLWRECTREATQELPLLDAAAFAGALQQAAALAHGWEIALKAAPGSEAALLLATQRAVRSRCRALNAAPASELLGAGVAAGPAVRLAGFTSVPPQLARLSGAPAAPAAAAAQGARLVSLADQDEEAAHIAAWCAVRIRAHPHARLLVLVPGSAGALRRLAALIRQALDPAGALAGAADGWVAIEASESLAAQPGVAHALTTLEFLAGRELETEELARWLCAPFWSHPEAAPRARIALALRDSGLPAAGPQQFLGALQRMPQELLPHARELAALIGRARSALADGAVSARRWAERFRGTLLGAGWPGTVISHAPGQELALRWHELLEEFGELTLCAGSLERERSLALLSELAARSPWNEAAQDASVTLAATLFDPVVRYDGIWVAGLDAQSFPVPAAPDPFIPLGAQLAAGVPAASAAARLEEARRLLACWQHSSDELVLSAPRHAQDLELLPTPLLPERAAATAPALLWLPARLHREAMTETLLDVSGLPFRSPAPLPRGTRSVELQNLCPFRAYAELRLGSARPESIEPGIPAHRRGTLLHAALQYLWERLQDSDTLGRMSDAQLQALVEQSVARARDELLSPPPPGRRRRPTGEGQLDLFRSVPPMLARECARAVRLIMRLCALERGRAPFRVGLTEYQTELALAGARLRLRIDRVDELPDGSRAILDYKSGRRVVGDYLEERPAHAQLLVYGAALPGEVAALATVAVNAHAVRFDGIARSAGVLPGVEALAGSADDPERAWRAQQERWRALIERLTRAFLAGEAAVDPRPLACLSCHVTDICRIREAHRAPEEDAPESAGE
jgi:ATP-dependent helicase/nuclease subunit B